jgi:hypothetical protein
LFLRRQFSENPEPLDKPSENQETSTIVEGTNVKPPTEKPGKTEKPPVFSGFAS